jgi:hypothetical protein
MGTLTRLEELEYILALLEEEEVFAVALSIDYILIKNDRYTLAVATSTSWMPTENELVELLKIYSRCF